MRDVRVEPKVIQVLQVLAERAGETVTKEEFFERVWGGRRLTDDVLTVTVSALRKALGDSARDPRFVQTVPGVGYRLIAPVREAARPETETPAPPRRKPHRALLAASVLFLTGLGWRMTAAHETSEAREHAAPASEVDRELRDRHVEAGYLLRRRESASAERARALLEGVITEAPDFAAAHVTLAEAHLLLAEIGVPPEEALTAARRAANAALALGESAAARAVLAQVRFALDWDFAGAEQEFRRALRVDPGNARAHLGLGTSLVALGRSDEALAHVGAYGRLDPFAYPSPFRAFVLTSLGRLDQAAAELSQLAANAPDDPNLCIFLGRIHAAADRTEDCYLAYDAYYVQTRAGDDVRAAFRTRFEDDGLRGIHLFILDRLEARARSGEVVSPVELAACHAAAGNTNEAFRWLEHAFEERDLGLPFISERPAFRALHRDPRFADLLARIGLA